MADLEPISIEFIMNSPELLEEFKKLLSGTQDVDAATAALKEKYKQMTAAQALNAKGSENVVSTLKNVEGQTKKLGNTEIEIIKHTIKERQRAINVLIRQYEQVNKLIDDSQPGKVKDQLLREAGRIKIDIDKEVAKLTELQNKIKSVDKTTETLTAQYSKLLDQMQKLEVDGKGNSEAYDALEQKALQYKEAIDKVAASQNLLSKNPLAGYIQGLSTLAGGISAVNGVTALFVGENENLEKIMVRIQALMGITIGLQQVQQSLTTTSSFKIQVLNKVSNLWTTANNRVAVSLGISNVAAKALMATLTLGLSLAITGLIVLFEKWSSAQAKAAEEQKKFASETADAMVGPLVAYKKLQAQWNSLAGDLKGKEKFIKDNKDKFHDLGAEVNNVNSAENFLVTNGPNFIEALRLRAEAAAHAQLAMEKYKESLDIDISTPSTWSYLKEMINQALGAFGIKPLFELPLFDKIDEKRNLEKSAEDQIKLELEKLKSAAEKLKEAGIKAWEDPDKTKKAEEIFPLGSVAELRKRIQSIDEALEKATDLDIIEKLNAKRQNLAAELAEAERRIRITTTAQMVDEMEQRWAQYYDFIEVYGKEAADRQFGDLKATSGSYFEWLQSEQKKLSEVVSGGGTLTDQQAADLEALNKKLAEIEGRKTAFDNYTQEVEKALKSTPILIDQLTLLDEKISQLSNSDRDQNKLVFLTGKRDEVLQSLQQLTDDFLREHQTLEEKKTEITRKYEAIRREIQSRDLAPEEAARLIAAAQANADAEVAAVETAAFRKTDIYRRLSENLIGISQRELEARITALKEILSEENLLTAEQRKKFQKDLEEAQNARGNSVIESRINQLKVERAKLEETAREARKKDLETYIKTQEEIEKINQEIENLNLRKLANLRDYAAAAQQIFGQLANDIGDSNAALSDTVATLSELAGIAAGLSDSVGNFLDGLKNPEGFTAGGIIGIAQGLFSAIGGLFSLGKKARESERKAQEEIKKRQQEKLQAELDYNAVLRQRIIDEVKLNDLYKSRVDNIREEAAARAKAMQDNLRDQQTVFNRLLGMTTTVGQKTEKYGGFLGIGRKTRVVDIKENIAALLGVGPGMSPMQKLLDRFSYNPLMQNLLSKNSPFKDLIPPETVMLSDELFDKLEKLNAEHPLTGDAKTAYEQLKKLRDEFGSLDEAMRQLQVDLINTITGTTPEAILDSIRQGLKEGKREFADWADDIEGFLRDAILSGLSARVIEPEIQKLQDSLAEMMGDGILTEEERQEFTDMYMAIVNSAREQLDLINQAGITIGDDFSGANSYKGAYRAASQESIDLLSGHTAGLRLAVLETNKINTTGFAGLMERAGRMIALQMDIERNTRRTANNTEKLHDIDRGVDQLGESMEKNYKALQAAGIIK